MTIVAFDGRILAADTLAVYGGVRLPEIHHKIERVVVDGDPVIFSGAGGHVLWRPMIEWYLAGRDREALPQVADLMFTLSVIRHGQCQVFHTSCPYPSDYGAPFALGCGDDMALGVMLHGGSAIEAVEIVCRSFLKCGLPLEAIDVASGEWVQRASDAVVRPETAVDRGFLRRPRPGVRPNGTSANNGFQ